MTTTYYPEASAPARPFGYDGPRPVMHNNFPAAMPQPADPSPKSSALRKGVIVLSAVAGIGAGVVLGVTLFGKDGSTSTQPVYLVPGPDGVPAAVQAPTSIVPAPAVPSPENVAAPRVSTVVVPPPANGSIINEPPTANPNPAPAPNPVLIQQAPAPIVVPFPVKTDPAPPAPPKGDPAPPKGDPAPKGDTTPPKGPTPPVDPNKLDPTKDAKITPPVDPNKLDPTKDAKITPKVPNPVEPPCGVLSC